MNKGISLALRNTGDKGEIFFSLVMRYKKQERIFPVGALETAKSLYLSCLKSEDELRSCWQYANDPIFNKEATEDKVAVAS